MSWPWIVTIVLLWLTLLFVIALVLGLLRRVVAVLEQAERTVSRAGGGTLELGLPVGSRVESFPVARADGAAARFPDLLKAPSIAVLMEAHCGPCRELLTDVRESPGALVGLPVTMLLDDTPDARALADGLPVEVLYVSDRAAAEAFQSNATPQAFTVAPGGVVLDRRVPGTLEDLQEMAKRQEEGASE
jgi:hypothetical protein